MMAPERPLPVDLLNHISFIVCQTVVHDKTQIKSQQ